jgi:hypothetical protein
MLFVRARVSLRFVVRRCLSPNPLAETSGPDRRTYCTVLLVVALCDDLNKNEVEIQSTQMIVTKTTKMKMNVNQLPRECNPSRQPCNIHATQSPAFPCAGHSYMGSFQ